MTTKMLKQYEKQLTEYTKRLNELGSDNWEHRYKEMMNIYTELKSLACGIGASLILGANILNVATVSGIENREQCTRLEAFIGELINNIHYAIQTKMMLYACVSAEQSSTTAKWACIWAAVAAGASVLGAMAACISVVLYLFVK